MPSRTRYRGNANVPSPVPGTSRIIYSNAAAETGTFTGSRVGEYEEMTDVVVPKFKRLQATGRIFNNPMSRSVFRYTASPTLTVFAENPPTNVGGKLRTGQEYWNLSALVRGAFKPPIDPNWPTGHLLYGWVPSIDEEALMSRAATAALSEARQEGAQGLVVAAELQKTLDTLRNPLKATFDHLRRNRGILDKENRGRISVKASVGKQVKSATRGASSQYLTWFYGLRTLMFDIEEILGAFEERINDRKTGRGFAEDEYVAAPVVDTWNDGSASHNATVTATYRESCVVRAGALVQLEAVGRIQRLGFDIRKIPEAAWELLPWSFVVDWFLNVQQVIAAIEATASNQFLAQWITRKRRLEWTRQTSDHRVGTAGGTWLTITSPCQDGEKVVVEMYDRFPQELSKMIGLHLNVSLNKVPTLAAISLVLQQLTK